MIDVSIYEKEEKIYIVYSDNGNGLIPKYKKEPDQILKQMVTSDIVNGKTVGTGMGLWIVNSIVNEYGGKIDLTKNIDSKTGFYIDIIL